MSAVERAAAAPEAPAAEDHAPGLERAFDFLPEERSEAVAVKGELPRWLRGTAYVNGPGRFARGGLAYRHWLDGDGLVCGLRFSDEGVRFAARFVRTAKWQAEEAAGRFLYRAFGTAFPDDRLVRGIALESPVNVSVLPFGGSLLAFGEQGLPWELDPETLETRGSFTFGGGLNPVSPFSAHAKLDPASGELWNFGVSFASDHPALNLYRFTAPGAQPSRLAARRRVPLPYPCSLHDFALAPRHAAFYLAPYLLDMAALAGRGATLLEALSWEPERGSRLLVLDRLDGSLVADVAVGNRYCLHLLNAWEEHPGIAGRHRRLTVDLLELDRPVYADYHDLPDLFADAPAGRAVRYVIDLEDGDLLTRRATSDLGTPDFPTLDRRRATRQNDEGWILQVSATGAPGQRLGRKFFDRLLHVRWNEGRVAGAWQAPPLTYLAGEPAFAPAASGDGATLVVPLWDAEANRSALALFDPFDVAAGPRATAWLAGRMPLGFHSYWSAGAA